MTTRKTHASVFGNFSWFSFGALLFALLGAPSGAFASDEFERGMEAYGASHYGEAVQLLQQAADRNDVRAQEVLGMMYWYGPQRYGSEVPRSVYPALDLLDRAATGGSEVAERMLQTMSRRTLIEARSRAIEVHDD